MPGIMKLIKVFDEYDNIIIKGKSCRGKYNALYRLEKKNGATVDPQKIMAYVESLQQKYPSQGFQLKIRKIGGKTYYVITKKSYTIVNGKKVIIRDRVPIYIDVENQEICIPKSYAMRNRKLTNYILLRALGALGIARVRYLSMAERVSVPS